MTVDSLTGENRQNWALGLETCWRNATWKVGITRFAASWKGHYVFRNRNWCQLWAKRIRGQEGKGASFFAAVNGSKEAFLYLCLEAQQFVLYATDVWDALSQQDAVQENTLSLKPVHIIHGFVEHFAAKWPGKNWFRNHIPQILEYLSVKDTISLVYNDFPSIGAKGDERYQRLIIALWC